MQKKIAAVYAETVRKLNFKKKLYVSFKPHGCRAKKNAYSPHPHSGKLFPCAVCELSYVITESNLPL